MLTLDASNDVSADGPWFERQNPLAEFEDDEEEERQERDSGTGTLSFDSFKSNSVFSDHSSIASVSHHFRQLFEESEKFIDESSVMQANLIRHRIKKMRNVIATINHLFEYLLDDSEILEESLHELRLNSDT